MKIKLQEHNDIKKDLLIWAKEYLVFKSLELFEKSTSNNVDDIIASIEKIQNSNTIDDVKHSVNLLVKDGISSLSRINNAIYKFYLYSVNNASDIKAINTNFLQDFKEWLTIGISTKKGYVDAVLELCEFIKRKNSDKFDFGIDVDIVRVKTKSIKKKMVDVMDSSEFESFSKTILKFKYTTEYERVRNILICRLLMFSGITVSELLSLELGKSFIVNDTDMLIRLKNRKRDIDLPRNLLISYFNKYKELSLKEKDYDVSHNPLISLSKQFVNSIIKELLEFAKIKREPLTPILLRYSFLSYLYNKRCEYNEITFNTIHDISGIVNKKELERILNTFDKDTVSIAQVFKREKF